MLRNRAHAKFGLARTCFENAVLGGVGQIEKFLARQARVEVFESWDDPGNCVSDQVVIVRQTQPVGIRPRSQRGVRQIGNDRYVAHQLRGSRRPKTFRRIDNAHRVFDGQELFAGLLQVRFAPPQARQDQRSLPGNQVRAV